MSRLAEIEASIALFDALPQAAQAEMRTELVDLGEAVLQIQQGLAPKRTGYLTRSLTVAEELDNLRLRSGYPDLKGGRDSRFYAIMQEYGVKAGSKLVRRRNTRAAKVKDSRGRMRHPVEQYLMTWRARAARPFVHIEDRIASLVDRIVDRFWDQVLANVGAE